MISTDSPRSRLRRHVGVPTAVLLVMAGMVSGCAAAPADRPGAPIESDAAGAATLERMAAVFEQSLAGAQVGDPPAWAERLAAVRPLVREHPDWPGADYAVTTSTPADGAGGAALVVWAEAPAPGSGWDTLCAATAVDRAGARLVLQQVRCPAEVPSEPVRHDAAGDRAALLGLSLPAAGTLASGEPTPTGTWVGAYRPTAPARAEVPCRAAELAATFDSGTAAGNTDEYILRVQNTSAEACLLPALDGLRFDDGHDTIQPPWSQNGSPVALHPEQSAATTIAYRPSQGPSTHQAVTAVTAAGTVHVTAIPGMPQASLQVANDVPITATAFEPVGYGARVGTAENGHLPVDIAPPCTAWQLAATTPPRHPSSAQDRPEPSTYRLVNIGTRTCRIDAGPFTGPEPVPAVQAPATMVLRPGFAADLDAQTAAPDLVGTLVVDAIPVPVTAP